jgi:sulfoxide reductase catalytic subunit YedY
MVLFKVPPSYSIAENLVTSENSYWNRRQFIKTIIGAGIGAGIGTNLVGCKAKEADPYAMLKQTLDLPKLKATPNTAFKVGDRPITKELFAGQYNNFYEFGGTKGIWQNAQNLPTENWKVEVGGLVNNPQTYDIDDLKTKFPLEERIYRFRCVEAWSMVLPWIGFPMRELIKAVEPTAAAKFVSFSSYYDENVTYGPGFHLGSLPWPYTEGLTIEEMNNELAFFALGIYGHDLPKQHGAPLRMVLPWKYGFKGAKSIVKIEFLATQPKTYWNTIDGREYKFQANVEPNVPHPRWSQASEKFIGNSSEFSWEIKETLPYNGYGEYVASLYS